MVPCSEPAQKINKKIGKSTTFARSCPERIAFAAVRPSFRRRASFGVSRSVAGTLSGTRVVQNGRQVAEIGDL